MEFTFTPTRIIIFVSLLVLFFLLDGFSPPDLPETGISFSRHRGSWVYCPILFIAGATSATLVDHWVGNIDRNNLRILYIAVGLIFMLAALLWNHALLNELSSLAD